MLKNIRAKLITPVFSAFLNSLFVNNNSIKRTEGRLFPRYTPNFVRLDRVTKNILY